MNALFGIYRFLFARPFFHLLNKALFACSLRGLGVLNFEATGEPYLISTVLPRLIPSERPIFVDVGANNGHYSSMLLERFPRAQIHAFEPHPASHRRLVQRLSGTSATCYNLALGESGGTAILFDRTDAEGSEHASLHQDVFTEIHKSGRAEVRVEIDTLDAVAARDGLTHIDLLKIDTEGSELSVLKGASRLLSEHRIAIVHFEFNEMNVVSRVFFRDFRKLIADFDFYRLLPHGLLPLKDNPLQTELFGFQNILAVRRR